MIVRGGARTKVAETVPEPSGPIQVFWNTIKESKRHLAAAAVARSVSIYGMFPVGEIFVDLGTFIRKYIVSLFSP